MMKQIFMINKKKIILIIGPLLLILFASLFGIILETSKENPEDQNETIQKSESLVAGEGGEQGLSVSEVITPQVDTSYISNPGIGWQYMGGSNTSLLPETVSYPDRQDISWKFLNPSEGSYDWSVLDTKINTAIGNGKRASFRIYTMRGPGFGGHQMPQWVVDKGVHMLSGEIDFRDCTYQAEWGRFVEALRQRYDGNSNISYIDVSGYGDFNEWSWQDVQTDWDDDFNNPTTLDGQARKRLVDMFLGGSKSNHQCRGSDGSTQSMTYNYSGFSQTQLIMPYAGIRQSLAYVYNKRADVGLRYDCLGRDDFSTWQTDEPLNVVRMFSDRWKTAPVVYELCSINWTNGSSFLSRANFMAQQTHAMLVHDNPTGGQQIQSNMESLMKYVGYRYELTSASYSGIITTGGAVSFNMNWRNTGYSPSYLKTGQDFDLVAMIYDGSNNLVHQSNLATNIESWLPAETFGQNTPNNLVQETIKPSLTEGTYTVKYAIKDVSSGKNIELGIQGGDSNNEYVLGELTVSTSIIYETANEEEPIESNENSELNGESNEVNQDNIVIPANEEDEEIGQDTNEVVSQSGNSSESKSDNIKIILIFGAAIILIVELGVGIYVYRRFIK
ncbi:MAG TPA: DUF4832 domain-containing protein [Candidatus Dojkabacteria bacterium]|jgi:hypothetical protein